MSRRTRLTAIFATAAVFVGLGTHELVASNDVPLATVAPEATATPQAGAGSNVPTRPIPTRSVHRTHGS
jgi:hypothetical protein